VQTGYSAYSHLHSIAAAPPAVLESLPPPSSQEIAVQAHDLYQRRGCEMGRDVEDWFEAERQLMEDRRQQLLAVGVGPNQEKRRSP